MDIHRHTIRAAQPPSPVINARETFVNRDKGTFASARATDLADDAIRFCVATTQPHAFSNLLTREEGRKIDSQGPKNSQTFRSGTNHWLIHNTKVRYDVPVLGLGNELGEDANVVKPTLGIGNTHDAAEEVDSTKSARMVPSILRAGQGVQVKVDAETVLARPLDGLEEVLPGGLCVERLVVIFLDCPVWKGNADEVEARASDQCEVLLGLDFASLEMGVIVRRQWGRLTINVL